MFTRFLLITLAISTTTTRFTYGLEDFLGLPVDYEQDIWDDESVIPNESIQFLRKLCDNYKLTLNKKEIDCESLTISRRELKQQSEHVLQKRDVTLDEGSGDAEHEEQTPEEEKMIPVNETKPQINEEETKNENDTSNKEIEEKQTEVEEKQTDVEETKTDVEETKTEVEEPKTEVDETEKENENPETEVTTVEIQEADAEQPAEIPLVHNVENENPEEATVAIEETKTEMPEGVSEIGPPAEQPAVPIVHEEVTHNNDDKETKNTEKENGKRGKKIQASPSDLAEDISSDQSGNAIDETLNNAEEAEKNVPKIKTASVLTNEEPKSGESSEVTGQGRKDTRILVGLFVTVLAVGSAAFTYNFIRKRKRNQTRTENGVTKSDPEEGREMKPLMKTTPNVDYKDETAEVKS